MAAGPSLKPIAQSLWRHPGARRRLSLAPRISVAVYAIVIAPWVELSTIAVWLAGIAAWEILALPRLRPLLQASARGTWRARLAESFLNAFGSVLYAWGLWVAMANAGPGGAFLAGLGR